MAENESSLLSLSSTQAMSWNYYNWCAGYPTGPVIWSAGAVICFVLGLPASLWVLHELIQKQRQRSTSDIFTLSLTVIDLTFTAHLLLSVCNFMIWHNRILEIVLDFIYCLSFIGRPLFMACICWDCYVAVVYPIVYKTSKKLIVVKKAITIILCLSLVVAGFASSTIQWITTTPFFAIPLIVAMPVILFCDISILRALRKPDLTGKSKIHPQKKQALHTISNSLIMTFIVYIPPVIMFSFGSLISLTEEVRYCCLNMAGFCFSMAGSVIMPLLYLDSVRKLKTFKDWCKK
ncbi:lysophosphatidic acid receptor 4-like [Clarias gariepinus]|uniref:lysophosphatidic acid receptor 4-like n=1 Tax=Clarias gariepinus TaxID=13013 RepID=UPI00234D515C|nr:lysophosphatidic acid receptor 4-like [Clarias gariepinus]